MGDVHMNNNDSNPLPPTVFVLFGAYGDLAWRLVVPALYDLYRDQHLPKQFILLGVGRKNENVENLAQHLREGVSQNSRYGIEKESDWSGFSANLDYVVADVHEAGNRLSPHLANIEKNWKVEPQLLFYLALPPPLFCPTVESLGQAALNRPNARLLVEKPLGHDLRSFLELEHCLRKYFEENQIYRIDHFLGKETAQNILALRFANPIFEPVWNRNYIDHVAITVAETLGVEKRAGYYESAGALRDMVQNHLLQLLCLVAMEPPVIYAGDDLRDRRMDVLHALRPIPENEISHYAARGQYDAGWINGEPVPAYRDEPGVAAGSNTETYAALKLFVDNWRWQDVPFYLRTGKRMAAPAWEISVRFRPVPHRAFPASSRESDKPVSLILRMQPDESLRLRIYVKQPGSHTHLQSVDLDFSYRDYFRTSLPAAYETLLKDIFAGDVGLFMRADQVEAAWRLVDPVLKTWANQIADFPNYAAGSWGPVSADTLTAADGHAWLIPDLSRHEHV